MSPWDTGAYAAAYGKQTPFGTLDHFYHLIRPHVHMYQQEMSGYGLDKIFKRWYGGASVLKGGFFYWAAALPPGGNPHGHCVSNAAE